MNIKRILSGLVGPNSPFGAILAWFRNSIDRRFAVAILPIVVGSIIVILGIDQLVHFRQQQLNQMERKHRIVDGYQTLIAEYLLANDLATVEHLIEAVEMDPEVTFAGLRNQGGQLMASSGAYEAGSSPSFSYKSPVEFMNPTGQPEQATLEVQITPRSLKSVALDRIWVRSITIASLILVLFMVIKLINGAIVAAPLNRMIDTIEANIRAGTLRPVRINSADQIARFGQAYNSQTEQIRKHQKELKKANTRLEQLVNERTAQLSDALHRAERATLNMTRTANEDPVTRLLNRRGFLERLKLAMNQGSSQSGNVVLYLLDLDRFKNVNDTLGHAVGDELLRSVSRRLHSAIRHHGILGRVGGDEFAFFVRKPMNEHEINQLAAQVLSVFKDPVIVGGRPIHAGISIGSSVFPKDAGDSDQLMANADIALYEAKDSGRGQHVAFSSEMSQDVIERDRIEINLRRGISHREGVAIYLQPKVDIRRGRIAGFEALVRWRDNQDRIIGPDQLLSVASERGLLLDLSEMIAEGLSEVVSEWTQLTDIPISLAMNIHADQLTSKNHLERVVETLSSTGIGLDNFTLEITEGCILGGGKERALDYLVGLRSSGLRLSLDDFGTGYASLTHLKQFPMDELKIDKSFVQNLGKDSGDEAIIRAAVDLAHAFDMSVVAEGVETESQLRAILDLGCDQVQGYLFGRPSDSRIAISNFLSLSTEGRSESAAA